MLQPRRHSTGIDAQKPRSPEIASADQGVLRKSTATSVGSPTRAHIVRWLSGHARVITTHPRSSSEHRSCDQCAHLKADNACVRRQPRGGRGRPQLHMKGNAEGRQRWRRSPCTPVMLVAQATSHRRSTPPVATVSKQLTPAMTAPRAHSWLPKAITVGVPMVEGEQHAPVSGHQRRGLASPPSRTPVGGTLDAAPSCTSPPRAPGSPHTHPHQRPHARPHLPPDLAEPPANSFCPPAWPPRCCSRSE